jgi:hypothetical protein
MPFIIAEAEKVKGEGQYPEYEKVLRSVQNAAYNRGAEIWNGFQPGGMMPGANQYGVGPLRKNDMANDTSDSTPSGSYSFNKTFTTTGWQDLFNFTIRDNTIQAYAGLRFSDAVLHVSQLRVEIEDRRFPIWDIQEAFSYDKFSVVLKEDEGAELIAEPRERVLIRGYVETTGSQRIVPIGLHLFRNLNAVLTEV